MGPEATGGGGGVETEKKDEGTAVRLPADPAERVLVAMRRKPEVNVAKVVDALDMDDLVRAKEALDAAVQLVVARGRSLKSRASEAFPD